MQSILLILSIVFYFESAILLLQFANLLLKLHELLLGEFLVHHEVLLAIGVATAKLRQLPWLLLLQISK